MTNNFQINTVYSDLLSKVHDNWFQKVSPNIQYLFGKYLSSLPINKKCISFYLFCLLSINLLSDKFKDYEEDRAKKDKIIQDLKSEVDSLSTKVEKLEKLKDQHEQYSRRNCLLVHGIAEEKEEITDEVILNTRNEKFVLQVTLRDI